MEMQAFGGKDKLAQYTCQQHCLIHFPNNSGSVPGALWQGGTQRFPGGPLTSDFVKPRKIF